MPFTNSGMSQASTSLRSAGSAASQYTPLPAMATGRSARVEQEGGALDLAWVAERAGLGQAGLDRLLRLAGIVDRPEEDVHRQLEVDRARADGSPRAGTR